MNGKRFFMNGDEWGLNSVLPAENADHFHEVVAAYRLHHNDTEFSPHGWSTPPFVIPDPNVPISHRNIAVADIGSILEFVMPQAVGVDSCVDFTGTPFPCPDCFAFASSLHNYWQCEGFYGEQIGGIVQSLHVTTFSVAPLQRTSFVDAIVKLGRQYDLLLFVNATHIVDLREPEAVRSFLDSGTSDSDT